VVGVVVIDGLAWKALSSDEMRRKKYKSPLRRQEKTAWVRR
jgi:hypothetical protein